MNNRDRLLRMNWVKYFDTLVNLAELITLIYCPEGVAVISYLKYQMC